MLFPLKGVILPFSLIHIRATFSDNSFPVGTPVVSHVLFGIWRIHRFTLQKILPQFPIFLVCRNGTHVWKHILYVILSELQAYSIPPVIPSDSSTLAGIKWSKQAVWHNQQSHPMPTLTHPFSKMSCDKDTEANGGQTMQVRKYPFCTFVRGLLKENVPLWDNSCV